jgi:DNA-directed RNA polymerase specialized sigma subunit
MDTLVALKQELNNLNENERFLLEKSLIENYTQSELATMLHTNQVQVSRKISKIKEKIKSKIV